MFDLAKDTANVAKHGVSLGLAEQMDLSAAAVLVDDREDYGEARYRAFGLIEGRAFCLVFTVRANAVRVISLRKANGRERKAYGLEQGKTPK